MRRRSRVESCASCTIGCEHIYKVGSKKGRRMEYESLFALGPLCGVDDPDLVLQSRMPATMRASTRSRPGARSRVLHGVHGSEAGSMPESAFLIDHYDSEMEKASWKRSPTCLTAEGGSPKHWRREPEGGRSDRPGLGRPRASRQGAGIAGIRPPSLARNGSWPGHSMARGRPRESGVRGRLFWPGRSPAIWRASPRPSRRSRPRTAPR